MIIELPMDPGTPGQRIHLSVIGGAHPYVWVGDSACYATLDTKHLRRLRDALTRALRDARKDSRRGR